MMLMTLICIGWAILLIYLIVRWWRGKWIIVPVPLIFYPMYWMWLGVRDVIAWYWFLFWSNLRDRRRQEIREFISLADRLHARAQKRKDILPLPPGG